MAGTARVREAELARAAHSRLSLQESQSPHSVIDRPQGIDLNMEVDPQPSTSQAAAAPELPTLALPVLAVVKEAQGLHGLKHSDYQRYRQGARHRWAQHLLSSLAYRLLATP